MRKKLLIIGVILLSGCCNKLTRVISIGDTTVRLVQENYGDGKVFVHLHANETTAARAARRVAGLQGGTLITLQHAKSRDIEFNYHGRHYAFDPNRIFTHQGIVDTLKQHNCYDYQVVPEIQRLAQQILAAIPEGKIIAVHNNKDYSLLDYANNQPLFKDAQLIYHNPDVYYRNFFFVTQISDFNRYKNLGFNVVLQSQQAHDDGSLSVRFKQRSYINVEAGFNQYLSQLQMLKQA